MVKAPHYLDKALNSLPAPLGLMPTKPSESQIVAMIKKISDRDEEKAAAIARTLNNTTVFNEVVREQITAMKVGERYEQIVNAFNSIRDDAYKMVNQLEDGKIDTGERLSNFWMKVYRGDIPSRLKKLRTRIRTSPMTARINWSGADHPAGVPGFSGRFKRSPGNGLAGAW